MFNKIYIILLLILFIAAGCKNQITEMKNNDVAVKYNLITPGTGIYAVIEKNVSKDKIANQNYEKIFYTGNQLTKIERYNKSGDLTDEFSVPAITLFEYNSNNNVKYVKYFDNTEKPAENELFGYWSVEYIYDELNRVRMEIYRDSESKFLTVPRDLDGNIANKDFIAPVLTYEYIDNNIKIKAFDRNFNLLKEIIGEKPCIPFIDCGDE